MTRAEQLDWEARWGRLAAAAAFVAIAFFIGGTIYLQLALSEDPDGADELFRVIDREPTDFIVAGIIQALGVLLLAPVLVYLYRVTRHRRPEVPKVAIVLAVIGPLAAFVLGIVRQAEFLSLAGDFVAGEAPPGDDPEDRAENLIDDSSLPVIGGIGFAANLTLGFAVILVSLHAMRAGLTSRFLGIIGIIVGALYVIPIAGGPQIVQIFWLGALGLLFLGRWPGGRGPAWAAGEAVPWPSAAEQQERRERERAGAGAAAELESAGAGADGAGGANGRDRDRAAAEPEPAAASADPDVPRQEPRPASRKRKRKKKR